jgi:hypothetical protein
MRVRSSSPNDTPRAIDGDRLFIAQDKRFHLRGEDLSLREARRRWAELLRKVFEVDPLKCPGCGGEMRIISFITQQNLIDQILGHIQARGSRGTVARAPPVSAIPLHPVHR